MNQKVHFDDFIRQVALESGFDVDTARAYVEALFETIVEENSKGEPVKIQKFGSFQPRAYKAKRGINPQTLQPLEILPHYHIHYAVSKGLEETLNNGEKSMKIALDEPKPKLLGRVILVAIIALLIGLLYRALFQAPQSEMPKEVTIPKQELQPAVNMPPEQVTQNKVLILPDKSFQTDRDKVGSTKTQEQVNEQVSAPQLPKYYRVKVDDTLSGISLSLYGVTLYWPLLYHTNQSKIQVPDSIVPDTNLSVPQSSEGTPLQKAYLAAYQSYLNADKMSQSFWTLCSGAQYMGSGFITYLSKHIDESEIRVIKHCVRK